MSTEILGERFDDKGERVFLHIGALGAWALFRHEHGLHQFDHRHRTHAPRTGREKERNDREIVRVSIVPWLAEDPGRDFLKHAKVEARTVRPAHSRMLAKTDLALTLFHEPSLRSLEFSTTGPRAAAVARGQHILHSLLAGEAGETAAEDRSAIVRRYHSGTAPQVKDLRTGRSTGRVEQVFRGEIDFLEIET